MDNLALKMNTQEGDEGDQDISYDYNFTLGVMDKLGNSICSTYHIIGVFNKEIIYMVKNATGVHVTK